MKKLKLSCNVHVESFSRKTNEVPENTYSSPISVSAAGIPIGTYTFRYDYPLNSEARFQHELSPNMSWVDVLLLAQTDYEHIYDLEDKQCGPTGNIPGMLNRSVSQGPYGIWGHHLSDLYFEGVTIDLGKMTVDFDMGS